MNLIKILINNFKEFFKISLSLFFLIIISLLLIFYNFKSNLIMIKNFDVELHGNFSYVVFNRISKPIFQNYKSNRVYLKKNKYTTPNSRTYSLFYLDNNINDKFIDKWKLYLKKDFQKELDSKLIKDFNFKNVKIITTNKESLSAIKSKINQEIIKQNQLIKEIKEKLILDNENRLKKNKLDNLNFMKNEYELQINTIENYLNSKIIFKEKENNRNISENKVYSSIFLVMMLLLFYLFANLYLFTFSKKSK